MRLRVNPKRTAKALTTPGGMSGNKPKAVAGSSSEKPSAAKVEVKKEKEEPKVEDAKTEAKKLPEPPPPSKEPPEPPISKTTVSNSAPVKEKKEKPPPRVLAKSPCVTLRGASQAKTPVTPKPAQKVVEPTPLETPVVTEKEKEKEGEDSMENKINKDEVEDKQVAKTELVGLGEEKQLVIKLDKLLTQEIPQPKRSERVEVVQKRKLSEESPRPATGKRGRPPTSHFEVQEIDADDPNFRHLVKALNR
ncbi:unnamed protein product, partial [Allacma fusca]